MSLRMRGQRENSAACWGDRVNTWGGFGGGERESRLGSRRKLSKAGSAGLCKDL